MFKNAILAAILVVSANCCYAENLETIKLNDKNIILSGERLDNGYCHDFVLEMDRGDNAPDRVVMNVNGGYWPRMMTICLRPGEEQLFFEARQGGDKATTEYRIFAIRKGVRELLKKKDSDKKEYIKQEETKKVEEQPVAKDKNVEADVSKVVEKNDSKDVKNSKEKEKAKPVERDILRAIFDNTESMGLIKQVSFGEKSLTVCLLDGTKQTISLSDKIWNRIENFYNRGYEPNYQGLLSLNIYDADNDGVDELYATQRMELDNTELGYVAARLTLQKDDSWKMSQYVLQMPSDPKDSDDLNAGLENDFYRIHTERIYLPKSQGAYPRFYCENRVVMGKINDVLQAEYKEDLRNLFAKNASMGFEVILSYEKILSIRFIGGAPRRNHFLHIDPRNGKYITLQNMFIIRSGFLKRMSELSPSKRKYKEKDLRNWYMKDTSLYIVLDEGEKQRAEQFKLGAFEEFLNPKNKILHVNEKKSK